MSGPNLAGMTREGRRKTILEQFMRGRSFIECSAMPLPAESDHMLKLQEIRNFSHDCSELEDRNDIGVKQIVEAMVWFNRDIFLFRGRPLSLLDRILRRFDSGTEDIFRNLSLIVEHVQSATLYVHIGGKTVVRVKGSPKKMYISEHSEFFEAAPPGYYLENYYVRSNGANNRTFTLNIIQEEMPFHFDLQESEIAIAYMLTKHMGHRCKEVLQGVRMCQQVAEYVSGEARVAGSIVATGVETECQKVDIVSRLFQTFEVKEDFKLKLQDESNSYQRLTGLNNDLLHSNIEWLSNSVVPGNAIEIGKVSSSRYMEKYIFSNKKVFKRNIKYSVCFITVLLALLGACSWATLSQDVSSGEKAEKWMTLALFGCIAIAFTLVGADRRRDMIRELVCFRREVFSSANMSNKELCRFICEIGIDREERIESIAPKNATWLGNSVAGSFEFPTALRMSQIPGGRLLLRKNGSITFSWAGPHVDRVGERFVRLDGNKGLLVDREAGAESGVVIECDVVVK